MLERANVSSLYLNLSLSLSLSLSLLFSLSLSLSSLLFSTLSLLHGAASEEKATSLTQSTEAPH